MEGRPQSGGQADLSQGVELDQGDLLRVGRHLGLWLVGLVGRSGRCDPPYPPYLLCQPTLRHPPYVESTLLCGTHQPTHHSHCHPTGPSPATVKWIKGKVQHSGAVDDRGKKIWETSGFGRLQDGNLSPWT